MLRMREPNDQKKKNVTVESGEPVALIEDLIDLKKSDGSYLDELSHSIQPDDDDVRVSREIVSDNNSNDCLTTKSGISLDGSKHFEHPIAVPGEVLLG